MMIQEVHSIELAADFSLPIDAVTRKFAILASSGAGKSFTAMKMAEQMWQASVPFCYIDPTGSIWGLRYAKNGVDEGLQIPIIGGLHGDMALTEDMGETIGRLLAERNFSVLIDLSMLGKNAQKRFMLQFLETIYHYNRMPLHLFIDEADRYAPQRATAGDYQLLGAMEDLVQRGRFHALGATIISQRAQFLSKSVLELVETMIILRTIAPRSREAVMEWVKGWDEGADADAMLKSLPKLATGQAWVWSPEWLKEFRLIQISARETFDSGMTPKLGEMMPLRSHKEQRLDFSWLAEALNDKPEPQPAGGDREALIQKLRDQISELQVRPPQVIERIVEVEVEVPVQTIRVDVIQELIEKAQQVLNMFSRPVSYAVGQTIDLEEQFEEDQSMAQLTAEIVETTSSVDLSKDDSLNRVEQAILKTLVSYFPMTFSLYQLALFSKYSHKSSSFINALASLRRRRLIDKYSERFSLTNEGVSYLNFPAPQPKTSLEVRQTWLALLPKVESKVLNVLIEKYPDFCNKQEIATEAGYSVISSSFVNGLSALVRHELAYKENGGYRASYNLFQD